FIALSLKVIYEKSKHKQVLKLEESL
ncbi:hypothetical protein MQ669_003452, partial [Acinetobacter nosocomialis]